MRIRVPVFRFIFGYDTSGYSIYNSTYKNIDIYLYIYEISLIYLYIYKNILISICTYKYMEICMSIGIEIHVESPLPREWQ